MKTNLFEIIQKLMDPEVIQSLPEELRMSPIDFIDSSRAPSSPIRDPELSTRYIELVTKLDKLNEEMRKLIPTEKQKLFARLHVNHIDVLRDLNYLEDKNLYRNGLRDGFWLAMEMIAGRAEILEKQNGAENVEKGDVEGDSLSRRFKAL